MISKEELVHQYYQDIYAFAFRKTGNQSMAMDITQETFLRYYHHENFLASKSKIKSYLFTIAYHLCIDYFRYEANITEEVETQDTKTPETELLEEELGLKVKKWLNDLREEEKDAIILRYYHHLSYLEIAHITNCNLSTIKSRVRLGIKKLEQKRKEEYDES